MVPLCRRFKLRMYQEGILSSFLYTTSLNVVRLAVRFRDKLSAIWVGSGRVGLGRWVDCGWVDTDVGG